jgi:phosphatidylserine/phosphatidylglycerophosphate/cardiolipin synthase-like enzyme
MNYVVIFLSILVISVLALAKQQKKPEIVKSVETLVVKVPVDGEVCFSPDEPCDVKLIQMVQSARKSIDVAIYDINLDQLVHELLVASKTIPVRILADRRQAKGEHSLAPLLIKAGAQLRYGRQRGIMHNKFIIVDGTLLETGSFNYTNHASRANHENQVYLAKPEIVERYKKRFEEIWTKGAAPTKDELGGGPSQSQTDQKE